MKLAECTLESLTPYSQSKYYKTPKLEKELAPDYEERTWRDRCHVTPEGYIYIPPMQFTNSLKEAARYLALPVPSKGKQTFTKHFEAGVLVSEPLVLAIRKEDVQSELLLVPADGRPGGGKRVEKRFPLILEWKGVVTYAILDYTITQDVFRQVLECSGNLIGIGRFRPRNRGYYGRFKVTKIDWAD